MIDVVILTWNDGDRLAVAVRSALASVGVDVHVTVVDNGSAPPARVDDDPRVSLIRNVGNRGVAGGRNQGARAGDRLLVCLLDSDARLHPHALAVLSQPLAGDPSIALSVPVFTGQPPEASAGKAPDVRRKLNRILNRCDGYEGTPRGDADPYWDVDFGIGACQLFRRSAYEQVGGIDESFFYGPEDADFCMRLKEAGWRVVQVAGADVDHPPRRRYRRVLTRRGAQHAAAVARFLWRHRHYQAHAS